MDIFGISILKEGGMEHEKDFRFMYMHHYFSNYICPQWKGSECVAKFECR